MIAENGCMPQGATRPQTTKPRRVSLSWRLRRLSIRTKLQLGCSSEEKKLSSHLILDWCWIRLSKPCHQTRFSKCCNTCKKLWAKYLMQVLKSSNLWTQPFAPTRYGVCCETLLQMPSRFRHRRRLMRRRNPQSLYWTKPRHHLPKVQHLSNPPVERTCCERFVSMNQMFDTTE